MRDEEMEKCRRAVSEIREIINQLQEEEIMTLVEKASEHDDINVRRKGGRR